MDYADGVQISGLIMLANPAFDAWRQILLKIDKMVDSDIHHDNNQRLQDQRPS